MNSVHGCERSRPSGQPQPPPGANVGDYAYCIARTRATNDFHGLGAFLIMNEQLRRTDGQL
ncbi:hypothetical protein [Streptomyces sp. GQFP]|uniref:hypothetical protein n=1 Tax=Streptomyces sp. GQFP TaxID=2907545 RepID=UPI001F1BC8A6|nr:hypothetical protein [Streptomyces sp. GQFP]UIX35699.1 hypothetical protein LUX31_06620 [Streptomyces sp. GQFP]